MRPGPPRRASASRGRRGLAAARGAERTGVARQGQRQRSSAPGMLARVGAGVSPPAALGAGRARSGSRRIRRRLFDSLEARVPPAWGFTTKLIFPEK